MHRKDLHRERIANRARLSGDVQDNRTSDCCYNHLLFALKDKHHEFTLGLETVLSCLYAAEKQGVVPPLPVEWWNTIENAYKLQKPVFQPPRNIPSFSDANV